MTHHGKSAAKRLRTRRTPRPPRTLMKLVSDHPSAAGLPPLASSVDDVAQRLGVSRGKIYNAIRAGRLRAVAWERRTLILEADLTAFLASLPALEVHETDPA